jgi:hypothetical protein
MTALKGARRFILLPRIPHPESLEVPIGALLDAGLFAFGTGQEVIRGMDGSAVHGRNQIRLDRPMPRKTKSALHTTSSSQLCPADDGLVILTLFARRFRRGPVRSAELLTLAARNNSADLTAPLAAHANYATGAVVSIDRN